MWMLIINSLATSANSTSVYMLCVSVLLYRYQVMMDCWQGSPDQRPSFTSIQRTLMSIIQDTEPYFEFDGEGPESTATGTEDESASSGKNSQA